jgi:hypothetical protein
MISFCGIVYFRKNEFNQKKFNIQEPIPAAIAPDEYSERETQSHLPDKDAQFFSRNSRFSSINFLI